MPLQTTAASTGGTPRRAAGPGVVRSLARRRLQYVREDPAVVVAWQALWSSRLVVLLSGVLAVLSFGAVRGSAAFDPQGLTAPFGYLGNLLVSPFARWDSVWYLTIAGGSLCTRSACDGWGPRSARIWWRG